MKVTLAFGLALAALVSANPAVLPQATPAPLAIARQADESGAISTAISQAQSALLQGASVFSQLGGELPASQSASFAAIFSSMSGLLSSASAAAPTDPAKAESILGNLATLAPQIESAAGSLLSANPSALSAISAASSSASAAQASGNSKGSKNGAAAAGASVVATGLAGAAAVAAAVAMLA
ncbi:hypothetical protein K437DRAFT_296747 [Tilletiaria anomala UBC 951]|uniref:Uncharacterized protein n=1 Tax=Tilletiaria anomala (strain ATCC 24038 / CBS 436.72 / UBC 951) TaxID=1037660 RepID=A0A066VDI8_TILAU|nr:uncharacterized protein K437DRAFT_296747 [Tilletiaria anomala UBC 951]KDN36665.1 hypothetical protein K437DRAFT_296747 [Tilletiaria anomala UBC 951]